MLNSRNSRRNFTKLLVMVFVVWCYLAAVTEKASAVTPEWSTFFSYADIEEYSTYNVPGSDGDLWPTAWAEDDYLYSINGDGKGFGTVVRDINVNKFSGDPYNQDITGICLNSDISQVWSGSSYNRKPTGIVCADGVLYCAVQDLNLDFNDAPAATICKSTDKGATWTWDTSAPMFDNYIFTTIMFLDYGKNNQYGTDGYLYAYGLDNNWRDSYNGRVPAPNKVFLARVLKESVMDRSKWQFYTGDLNGNASWSYNINDRTPVLQDDTLYYTDVVYNYGAENLKDTSVISQGSIVYNQPLNRYIYSSWADYVFEFYESPTPFGPWKKFLSKDYGPAVPTWTAIKNGGYSPTIPSKFISSDGKTMWVQSNCFGIVDNYYYSLRKLVVQPYTATAPANVKSGNNLALPANAPGVTAFAKAFHFGRKDFLNDGNKVQNEYSWNGAVKSDDYWGYYYPTAYNMNKVAYTTGYMFHDGGWFDNLKVQVRKNLNWIDVTGLSMTPVSSAGNYITYTFTFDDTWGDGVRIIGAPGGTAQFSSIAELEVYYSNINPNLVADSGFENQTANTISAPWQTEGAGVKGVDRAMGFAATGANNVFIRTDTNNVWNCIKQTIAVTPNTSYRLTGYIKNSNNFINKGYFGVRNSNQTVLSEVNFSGNLPNYQEVAVDFNSGSNTSITVFGGYWSTGIDTWVQFDDIVLRKQ